jgi:hypothetical protein
MKSGRTVIIFGLAFVIATCISAFVFKVVGHQPGLGKPPGTQWMFYAGLSFLFVSLIPLPFIKRLKYKKLLNSIFLTLFCTFMLFDTWYTVGHQPIFFCFFALGFLGLVYVILRDIRNWNRERKAQETLARSVENQ